MLGDVSNVRLSMKAFLIIFFLLLGLTSTAKNVHVENDTIMKSMNVALLLDNGFALPSFSISGDIFLLKDHFVFHPRPYHGKRYEMFNDMINDIKIPYDSILSAKKSSRIFGGLLITTKSKKYKISIASSIKKLGNKRLGELISQINKSRESKGK